MKQKYKPTILIDLDGVLNTYNGEYQEDFIPPIKEGAQDFIKKLYKKYTLVLFTTRDKQLAGKWLTDNGLEVYFEKITKIKIPAYIIIDDRCLNFRGDYYSLLKEINNFVVWYKM